MVRRRIDIPSCCPVTGRATYTLFLRFLRHAAQDAERTTPTTLKNDLDTPVGPYAVKQNFHGPNTDTSAAEAELDAALHKSIEIRKEYLGDQFAGVP